MQHTKVSLPMIIHNMNLISMFFFNKPDILQGTGLKRVRPRYPSVVKVFKRGRSIG